MSTKFLEVVLEEGVKDLPLHVRAPFARALVAERLGDNTLAATMLDTAIGNAERGHAVSK